MPGVIVDLSNLKAITNDVFWPLYSNTHRRLVLMGGGGSGKSVFAACKIAIRLMSEEGHFAVAFRKVARTLKSSVTAQMKSAIKMLGVEELWQENKEDRTLTFAPNGNVFMALGLDDAEKVKSIVSERGNSITIAWLEEATEMSEADDVQVELRMRGISGNYKQTIYTFNPVFHRHWLRRKFFDKVQPNTTVLQTTYLNNRFLDPEYGEFLEGLKESDETLWLIYARGQWGVIKGVIFSDWPVVEKAPDDPDETIYGLDFGWNAPSALIRIDIKDKEIYFTEYLYETKQDVNDIIACLVANKVSESDPIYSDSADPGKIDALLSAGYNALPQIKGAGSVKAGIDFLKSIQKLLHIVSGSQNLVNERQTYKYKEKNGEILDEPLQVNDHAIDAVRCALYTHILQFTPFSIS